MEGIVLRRYSSFYYVQAADMIWECRLRGRQRLKKDDVLAGDRVSFNVVDGNQGIIEEILPRKTMLKRPSIANATMLIIITSLNNPLPNWGLLDRLLVLGDYNGLKLALVFNKIDIADKETVRHANLYETLDYNVFYTSAIKNIGVEKLKEILKNEIAVLAGPSGAGKSSIINALEPTFSLKIGEVSAKMGSGKHTTRYVSLLPLDKGGFITDTPGFNKVSLPRDLKKEELGTFFPEIEQRMALCRFKTCMHKSEPDCKVIEAVKDGTFNERRYKNYLALLEEIIENERRF